MEDQWALLVAVLAFLVSSTALLVASRQLALQRDAAGGRGVIFDISRLSRFIDNRTEPPTVVENFRVLVKVVGNERHEVVVYLERGGIALEEWDSGYVKPLPVRHLLSCQDDPLIWEFGLSPDIASDLRCVLLWVEPFRDGIRDQGFRSALTGGAESEFGFEQWHWYRSFRIRRRFESWAGQRGPRWFRDWVGRPRRLGEWRPYKLRPLQRGQSPRSSGAMVKGTRGAGSRSLKGFLTIRLRWRRKVRDRRTPSESTTDSRCG